MFLVFTCDFCLPIKYGFLNVSPFEADMNCFCFFTFYSVLTFLYFYTILIIIIIFAIIAFVIAIAIIISSFSMLLPLFFTIVFYLCIYQIFLNFKQMTWPNIVKSWQ